LAQGGHLPLDLFWKLFTLGYALPFPQAMFSSLRAAAGLGKSALRTTMMQQERGYKCAVLGAAGGIGQPLALLLKLNEKVTSLSCYDVAPFTPGVGVDLSHINTGSSCKGYVGDNNLKEALDGCDVVVIPAGVPRKPGMTRDDLFNINAGIVKTLISGVADACPKAAICIISNPVNSTVPIAKEVLLQKGVYNPKKLFGVTTLDVCRARTFVGNSTGTDPGKVNVPVVGGHAGTTIVPLLSRATPSVTFSDDERDALTHRIMFGGDEVVKAKDGAGSATLSMAFAGAEFADKVMAGLSGEKNVVECTFVDVGGEQGFDDAKFFSTPVTLGKEGVEKIHPYGDVNAHERKLITDMLPDLKSQAEKGFKWATENK